MAVENNKCEVANLNRVPHLHTSTALSKWTLCHDITSITG